MTSWTGGAYRKSNWNGMISMLCSAFLKRSLRRQRTVTASPQIWGRWFKFSPKYDWQRTHEPQTPGDEECRFKLVQLGRERCCRLLPVSFYLAPAWRRCLWALDPDLFYHGLLRPI